MGFFWLRSIEAPWGDYGHILLNGMSAHLRRVDGKIQLERTGPFLPALTFPRRSDVLLTNAARASLEVLVGPLPMLAVDKVRIVRLDWEKWDPMAPAPPQMPPSGSPESYLLDSPHDPVLSAALGDIWEMRPDTFGAGVAERVGTRPSDYRVKITVPQTPPPIFRVDGLQLVFVRQDVADALSSVAPDTFGLMSAETQ